MRRTAGIVFLLALSAASAARAETVTATLTFTDGSGAPAPIANATVEIWRFRPRGWFWTWGNDLTTSTDARGRLSATMPFAGNGVIYGLRVFATNPAAVVYTQDAWATNHFNAADAVLRGFNYASARRDPRETDTIAQLAVLA